MTSGAEIPLSRTVCFPFVGSTFGGSHIASLTLASRLPTAYRPMIVVHEPGPLTAHLDRHAVEYRMLPLPVLRGSQRTRVPLLLNVAQSTFRLVSFLHANQVAIVHGNDGRINVTWGPAARIAGARLVWHQHSRYVPSTLANLFVRLADRIVGVSRYSLEQVPRFAHGRMAVVANPFDVDATPPNRRASRDLLIQKLGVSADAVIIGFFGNLTEQKRPELFAEIIERIRVTLPAAVGIVCGDEREPLASRMRGNPHVHLMGFQYPPEPVIAGCDLLLAPAVGEGFGRTLVEAMLVGTPVVATRSGGHCDIVSEGVTGLLANADDVDDLATATLRVLGTPELARSLAERALAAARQTYSVAAHAAAMAREYETALTCR